jgi:hypothetical protein
VNRSALKQRVKAGLRSARRARNKAIATIRLASYQGRAPAAVGLLPKRLRLSSPPPGERRIEFGSGWSPRPGYIHVDVEANNPLTDVIVRADQLELPDGWADEILSVHMIEHVPPPAIVATLERWRRLLRAGGTITVHTPNAAALGAALADTGTDDEIAWVALSAVYGYGLGPWDAGKPELLRGVPDHKLVFTPALLIKMLEAAGFVDVKDVSGNDPLCHHTKDWAPYVPGMCLEVSGRAP